MQKRYHYTVEYDGGINLSKTWAAETLDETYAKIAKYLLKDVSQTGGIIKIYDWLENIETMTIKKNGVL